MNTDLANTHCMVCGTLATVLRLSRLVGLAPLTIINTQNGWRISLSPAWNVYGYILITVICINAISSVIYMKKNYNARIYENVWKLFLNFQDFVLVLTNVAIFTARSHMKSIISCLNLMEKTKNYLNICHSVKPMKWNRTLLGLWMIMNICHAMYNEVIVAMELDFTEDNKVIYGNFAFGSMLSWCYIILTMQVIQFITVALHVYSTYKDINGTLKTIIKDVSTSSAPLHHRRVRRLGIAYVSMCDVVRELNSSYGLLLMLLLICYMIGLNWALYFLISFLVSPSKTLLVEHVSLAMVWFVYLTFNVVFMIEPCHITHFEMEKTGKLVGELMRATYSLYQPLAVELQVFHRHLVLNQASFSPLMIFTMNRSLVITIFGSITTYLVILLQLK